MTYRTDLTGERLVEPYAIYFDPDGATLKLVAYDHTDATLEELRAHLAEQAGHAPL